MSTEITYARDAVPASHRFDSAVSWAALMLLIATASSVAWYVPRHIAALKPFYKDVGLKFSKGAQLILDLPTGAVNCLSAATILGAIVVQIVVRSRRSATAYHLLVTAFFIVVFLAYREVMGEPGMTVLQNLSSRALP